MPYIMLTLLYNLTDFFHSSKLLRAHCRRIAVSIALPADGTGGRGAAPLCGIFQEDCAAFLQSRLKNCRRWLTFC